MKYSLNTEKQELLEKIDGVEQKLDKFIEEAQKMADVSRKEMMQFLQELREEILSTGKKSEEERQAARRRRAKAFEQFRSG